MKDKVLFVIDTQVDFLLPEGKLYLGSDTTKLVDNISNLIKYWIGDIIFFRDSHYKNSCEFKIFPEHCMMGTPGIEIHPGILAALEARENKGYHEIIDKNSFKAGPSYIAELIETYENHEFHFTGVCSHICVHDNIVALAEHMKWMHNKNLDIYIHVDCIDDFDKGMEQMAVRRLQTLYGAKIITE